MEPAIVSAFIKSDRLRKRFPKVGEMVKMKDRKGLLVVTRLDREQKVADLSQRVGLKEVVEENVPLESIRTFAQETSRLIQDFLHS